MVLPLVTVRVPVIDSGVPVLDRVKVPSPVVYVLFALMVKVPGTVKLGSVPAMFAVTIKDVPAPPPTVRLPLMVMLAGKEKVKELVPVLKDIFP